MAFQTSGSLFGSRPSTGTSAFGQTSTPQQQGSAGTSLFGQSNPQQGSSLFGQTSNQQPATSSSLFGQSSTGQQQGGSGSLFGQPNTSQQGSTGNSLFGQNPTGQQGSSGSSAFGQSQQGPTGGSLFGQSTTNQQGSTANQPFGQNTTSQQGSTGLFGQNPQNPQQGSFFGSNPNTSTTSAFGQTPSQQSQGSSVFGTQQQQQPTQTGSLFGGFGQKPATSGGLFGQSTTGPQTQQQQSAFGSSLFGGGTAGQQTSQQQPQSNLFGNLGTSSTTGGFSTTSTLFGNRPASQQPSLLTAQTMGGAPLFTKSTKFNDLPDEVKKIFEQIDTHVQGRIQISNELKQRKLGDEARKGQEVIYGAHQDLLNTISIVHADVHATRDLKSKVDQTVQDTIIAIRIIDGFRNPQQYGVHLKNHADFPLEFFNRVTEEMKERLRWCKVAIEAIERKLSSAISQTQYTPQVISSVLEAQHRTFISLASKTAQLDAELQKIKSLYTQVWRAKTGSMRDPFNDLDRTTGDFGLEGLSGK